MANTFQTHHFGSINNLITLIYSFYNTRFKFITVLWAPHQAEVEETTKVLEGHVTFMINQFSSLFLTFNAKFENISYKIACMKHTVRLWKSGSFMCYL